MRNGAPASSQGVPPQHCCKGKSSRFARRSLRQSPVAPRPPEAPPPRFGSDTLSLDAVPQGTPLPQPQCPESCSRSLLTSLGPASITLGHCIM